MRRAASYAQVVAPDRPLQEYDCASCCHCGAVIFTKPGTVSTVYLLFNPKTWRWEEEPGASCWHCMKPVCLPCHDLGTCRPLERYLEELEGRACRPMLSFRPR